MAKSCAYKPNVKNKEGKIVNSRLFDSLLSFFNKNRNEAKKHYFIANHSDFLEAFKEDLEFDENGEVTLDSYLRATKQTEDNVKFLQYLNKEYGSGEYDVDEAISKAQSFTKSEFKKNYIPSLVWKSNGKVHIEYIPKTSEAENNLYNFYKQKNLYDRIIKALRAAGVDVTFIDNPKEGAKGRYSTVNAEQLYNGLYNLISIFNRDTVVETLAEEAGHFVYAALYGTNLVQRLNNALTDDVINSLELEALELYSYEDRKKEAAGKLIGKALLNINDSPFKSLINRIITTAKKTFAKITKDEVLQLKLEAEEVATKAVENFLSPNFTGSVETALSQKETLYSKSSTNESALYAQVRQELLRYKKIMSNINYKLKKKYKTVDMTLSNSMSNLITITEKNAIKYFATSGIVDVLTRLCDDYQSLMERLDKVDLFNKDINYEYLDTIKEARAYLVTTNSVLKLVKKQLSKPDGIVTDDVIKQQLIDVYYKLEEMINNSHFTVGERQVIGLQERVEELETEAYLIFLEKTYGSRYITRANKVVLEKWNKIKKIKLSEKDKDENLEDYLTNAEKGIFEEDDALGYFFRSFQSIKDPTMSILNDMIRQAKRYANSKLLRYRTELLNLYDYFNDVVNADKKGFGLFNPNDAAILFETDENGNFTGNIIQPVLWGKWEKDLHEFRESCKKEFEEKFKDNPKKINTPYKRAKEWHNFYNSKIKEWHLIHSIKEERVVDGFKTSFYRPATGFTFEDAYGRTITQANYINEDWHKLTREQQEFVNRWMDIKRSIDNELGRAGHTVTHRLPQFRGELTERIKTVLEQYESGKFKGVFKTIGEVISEEFSLNSDDSDYGSDMYYSSLEDMFLDPNGGSYYGESLNRIPLYGINKLEEKVYYFKSKDGSVEINKVFYTEKEAFDYLKDNDLNESNFVLSTKTQSALHKLSRDLFHSTLLYAEMACKYKALQDVAYAADMGKQVYENRHEAFTSGKMKNSNKASFDVKQWRAFSSMGRFDKFIDKQINGIYNTKKIGKRSINKIMSYLGQVGSKLMLGGNITVGFKDFAGKINGILREAHIEEFCSAKSVGKAIGWYLKHCWLHSLNFANDKAEDEMSLFKLYFNVGDIFDKQAQEFNPQKSRIRKLLKSATWSPLSMSASVEVIVYAAMAFEAKVKNTETGEELSLMDLFHSDVADVASGKRKILKQRFTATPNVSEEEWNKYKIIESTQIKLQAFYEMSEEARELSPLESLLTVEEKDYISKFNTEARNNINLLLPLVTEEKESNEVSILAENKLVEAKSRLMLNRIAGIYNLQDRSAFQDTWIGVAALNMKGWFNGILAEGALMSNRFSPLMRKEGEGFFASNYKFLVDLLGRKNTDATDFKVLMKALGSTIPIFGRIPLLRQGEEELIEAGYSKHQYNNIRRNIDNITSILVLQILSELFRMLSLKGLGEDDDEPDDPAMYKLFGILHYLLKATRNEFIGMYNPYMAFQQAMNFTSVNAFTPIAILLRLGELFGYGGLELLEEINTSSDDEVYEIIKEEVEGGGTVEKAYQKGTWSILIAKDKKTKEHKYEKLMVPVILPDGTIAVNPKTGKPEMESKKDSEGRDIYIPVLKSEYQQDIKHMGVEKGDSKFKKKLKRMLPIIRHEDVWIDPLTAAENLQVVWDKNKR